MFVPEVGWGAWVHPVRVVRNVEFSPGKLDRLRPVGMKKAPSVVSGGR